MTLMDRGLLERCNRTSTEVSSPVERGLTTFEVAVGATPFDSNHEEQDSTSDTINVMTQVPTEFLRYAYALTGCAFSPLRHW